MRPATDRQIDYILALVARLTGEPPRRHLDSVDEHIATVTGLSRGQVRRGLTSSQATTAIRRLRRAVERKAAQDHTSGVEPLTLLAEAVASIDDLARQARSQGATWVAIGRALGVSPATARRRYGAGRGTDAPTGPER